MVSLRPPADHGIATELEQAIAILRPFLAMLVQETCGPVSVKAVFPKGPV
jgi:hypothetical protein